MYTGHASAFGWGLLRLLKLKIVNNFSVQRTNMKKPCYEYFYIHTRNMECRDSLRDKHLLCSHIPTYVLATPTANTCIWQWRIQGRGLGRPGPPYYLRIWMTTPTPTPPFLISRSGSGNALTIQTLTLEGFNIILWSHQSITLLLSSDQIAPTG